MAVQSPPPPARPRRTSWLGAFAHPGFAIVWTASTIALVGIAMYDTASGWLMTTLDLDPFDVAALDVEAHDACRDRLRRQHDAYERVAAVVEDGRQFVT